MAVLLNGLKMSFLSHVFAQFLLIWKLENLRIFLGGRSKGTKTLDKFAGEFETSEKMARVLRVSNFDPLHCWLWHWWHLLHTFQNVTLPWRVAAPGWCADRSHEVLRTMEHFKVQGFTLIKVKTHNMKLFLDFKPILETYLECMTSFGRHF